MLGYEFLRKTPELFEQRRVGLDRYANLAQISQLLLHLTVGILALLASNQIKRSSRNGPPATMLAFNARRLQTALGTEAAEGYGTYGQWTFGIAYTAWLGYLCIAETAPDYLHLTKRFGLIAASQLPIHYLLSATRQLKQSYRLNMALHKVTGKIILVFIALHIFFYANLFVQFGIFWNSIKSSYIVVALISAGILFTLGITSIQFFRRMNYSWFYKIHVVGSTVVLPLLYFHVKPLRIYLLESAGVIVMNAGYRMLSSRSKTM